MSDGYDGLLACIADGSARIAVVGLGYVGTPVACCFADAGFGVVGFDVSAERVAAVAAGRSPFESDEPGLADLLARVVAAGKLGATTDPEGLRGSQVVLVAVQTPVEAGTHLPAYRALLAALATIGPRLASAALVVVESTLAPGSTTGIVVPALTAATGRPIGDRLFVVHCPERVMPGRLLANIARMSRVIGGVNPASAELAAALYRSVVAGDLDLTDALTAEIVKTGENAYRDVQIAFANEMALLCESLGGDVWRARALINKSPGRNMLLPGGGVGGHCIPKDPWLLIARAGAAFEPRLVPAARSVNDGMPAHVASLVSEALSQAGLAVATSRVAILGAAYLEDSDDDRNAPTARLVEALVALGAEVAVHDPFLPGYRDRGVESVVEGCDVVVLMVAHGMYRQLDLAGLRRRARTPLLVDARRFFEPDAAAAAGWRLRTLGVGSAD